VICRCREDAVEGRRVDGRFLEVTDLYGQPIGQQGCAQCLGERRSDLDRVHPRPVSQEIASGVPRTRPNLEDLGILVRSNANRSSNSAGGYPGLIR
jgi:hypothetical protein